MANEKEIATGEGYITTDDGVRLFFRKIGSDPRVVIVPNGFYFLDEFARFSATHSLIFYDVRNRGRSDSVTDPSKLARGIAQDVDDLDTVRRHFGIDRIDLIGHSYVGLMVGLYAMKYAEHVSRVVQIGPMQHSTGKQYPAHLNGDDGVLQQVFASLAQLQKQTENEDPEERCRKFWAVLRRIYVTDAANAEKIDWGRCELPNERNFMQYWNQTIFPSLQKLNITAEDFAKALAPVLTVHGARDRSAPYGGARDWASALPNARLLTVEKAGHAPWIESPEKVFSAIETFLEGNWPAEAEKVKS